MTSEVDAFSTPRAGDRRLRLLCIGVAAEPLFALRFDSVIAAGLAEAKRLIAEAAPFDAVLLAADSAGAEGSDLDALIAAAARIVVVDDADGPAAAAWLQRGADDVIGRDELPAAATGRRILFAVLRRRRATGQLAAWSTDPGTGLPHRQQFVEHLSQLLALREREPSPMAVLVLRIEGLLPDRDGADGDEAGVLRRKLAVRLRAGLRSSDVVAALDGDGFAVLLGSVLAAGDAERVAEKLVSALLAPLTLAGGARLVAVAVGIGNYPQDGKDAEKLLRRASALAAVAPASGSAGPATAHDASGAVRVAANDDT
ncbi:MAG: diguanylate cyclase [Caldimonas sp.]